MFAPPSLVSMKMFGLIRVEPDDVVVAVRRVDVDERLAAVGRVVEVELRHPDVVLVLRTDEHLVEVERPRAQRLAAVDERPVRAAVGRAIQSALRALRFDLRVDDLRIRLRDVDPDLADQIVGKSVARRATSDRRRRSSCRRRLRRRAAADDRPRLALSAPRAGVELVRDSTS